MIIGRSSTKFLFLYADQKFKMAATAGHKLRFPIGIKNIKFVEDLPMIIPGQFGFNCLSGFREEALKCSNAFFSETTNMIKAKLYMKVHWMVLYKFYVFCSDMKFKMAATAGLSLTLDPMGKMFQAFEHFPIGSNVNLCPAVVAILDFRSA
jgi:hypothetical protein